MGALDQFLGSPRALFILIRSPGAPEPWAHLEPWLLVRIHRLKKLFSVAVEFPLIQHERRTRSNILLFWYQ